MPTVQFDDIPFALETPAGDGADALVFNGYRPQVNPITSQNLQTGPQWILEQSGSAMGAAKRLARDGMPQKPGEIIHRKYRTGVAAQLRALAVDVKAGITAAPTTVEIAPACDEDLVDLFDLLSQHLHSIENADGRLTWLPSNKADRMLDFVRWIGADAGGGGGFQSITTERESVVFTGIQFGLLTPFPYGLDRAQVTTCLGGATPNCSGSPSTVLITNTGSSEMWPVIRVYGPFSSFQIDRESTVTGITQSFIWSDAFPGAPTIGTSHFLELDFFRETAYVDADQANAKPGIDIPNSDFWPLEIGDNILTIAGASADVFWQNAYTG